MNRWQGTLRKAQGVEAGTVGWQGTLRKAQGAGKGIDKMD